MLDRSNAPDELIDRYVRQQLDADERIAFEIQMLEDPALFDAVQEAELMHQAFEETDDLIVDRTAVQGEREQSEKSEATPDRVSHLPFRLWIKEPMSLAASVMLGIGVLLIANLSSQQPGTAVLQSGYGVNSVVSIGQTRSAASEIVLPSGIHLLQVDVGISLSEATYILSLSRQDNGQVYDFQVTADGNGMVRLLTPANLQGSYQLRVQQQGSNENPVSYSLRFE